LLAALRHPVVCNGQWQLLEFRLGMATGPPIVFWFLPGKAQVKSGWW
jgi:hypothetical protein